ncbi:MAG: class I SAM-dependent methyltransferase [Pseudomonadota bacterium]
MNLQTPALVALLAALQGSGYAFTTPTPLTQQRVLQRRQGAVAQSLRDVFGWNLTFDASQLAQPAIALAQQAGVLQPQGNFFRSTVRVSSLHGQCYLHSAFPTDAADAVFFGPDTYRFANFLRQHLQGESRTGLRLLDIGCGSGAGGLYAASLCPHSQLVLNDINPQALRFAAANAQAAGVAAHFALGDALSAVQGDFDLIIANPPYLADDAHRAYRDGGSRLGRALSVRMATEALPRLKPGGRLLLYTGVAMVDGRDPFLDEMEPLLNTAPGQWQYHEIDPDVFGEELERPAYQHCDRIAAVGLAFTRS